MSTPDNEQVDYTNGLTRAEYYKAICNWDGICYCCSHDYFTCKGTCGCPGCTQQRKAEVMQGLTFREDTGQFQSNN